MRVSIFRSAVTGTDGTVNPGYLSIFMIMAAVFVAIPFMCIFTTVAMFMDPTHKFDVQGLGIGIGSVCGGFGVAVGAVGAFVRGDQEQPRAPTITTTTEKETIVQTAATPAAKVDRGTPDKPIYVAIDEEPKPKARKVKS